MSVIASETAAYTVAGRILDAVRVKLAASAAGPPSRVGVVNGAIAWDRCECGGGQLAVAPARMYLTDTFPVENFAAQIPCGAAYLACDYVLQIIRCSPMPQPSGDPPSMDALDASAKVVLADGYLAVQAVACGLLALVDDLISDYAIRAQTFVGPQGGCVGSEILFTAAFLFRP